jgi:flagellar protein FliO/FliZ
VETVFIALRVALSLGVVLGLLWVLQRRLISTGRAKRAAGVVNVVTRQGISPKVSVVVVDVDGTRFVLGVTDSSVTVLHSADAPAEAAALALVPVAALPDANTAPSAPGAASAGAFASSLSAASAAPVPARDDDAAYRRPRNRDRKPANALEGSVLSAATWRQAGAALRQRRAG